MMFHRLENVDLVNFSGISAYMFTDDFAYKQLPESIKHYSIAKHLADTKMEKYQQSNVWRNRLRGSTIGNIVVKTMDYYSKNVGESNFSIVDVGSQYGIFSLGLAKYIKTTGMTNINKIFAFDCGIAGKLTEYNIKFNQLENIIKFEYKAVSNVSIPHLVYYNSEHSEDNHIVRRNFISLPSYVVDGTTLDDYFRNNNTSICNLIIKIDAQGVEPLLFEGMQKILCDFHGPPPVIIFEFVPWVCKTIKDPVQFLNSLPEEYLLFDLNESTNKNDYNNDKNPLQEVKRNDYESFVNKISRKSSQSTDLLMLHENSIILAIS